MAAIAVARGLRPRQPCGFTLIEVMVALAIVAIALSAGAQASGALLRNAQRQSDTVLAQLCAENELIKTRLSRQFPVVGDSSFSCSQAGTEFNGTLSVRVTPNPNFRRVEAHIRQRDAGFHVLTLVTLVGRF